VAATILGAMTQSKTSPDTGIHLQPSARPIAGTMLNKVPEVVLLFWVVKIMSTTVGETAADFLAGNLGLGLTATSLLMAALMAAVLGYGLGVLASRAGEWRLRSPGGLRPALAGESA
jgi:hypothetical protein